MKKLLALCGDDCAACPRYRGKSETELQAVAELWFRIGWRDRILLPEEMACSGCSPEKQCTYHLVDCTRVHGVDKCGSCSEFPCGKIEDMLNRSAQYQRICRERCSETEYAALEKAFFEKEENLRK